MSKFFVVIVALLSFYRVAAAGCDDGVAVIAGKTDFAPLSWQQEDTLDGIAFTMMKKIMGELDIALDVNPPAPWKRVLKMTSTGEVDILVTVRDTDERRESMQFVPTTMLESAQNVFYRSGDVFENIDDLTGKVGGVTLGLRFSDQFSVFAKEKLDLQKVPRLKQNILKLQSGRIDYFISPLLPTLHYIHQNKIDTNISFMLKPLFVSEEKVAISKKSSCLKHIDYISKRIQQLNDSGEVDALLENDFQKWNVMSSVMNKINNSEIDMSQPVDSSAKKIEANK